MGLGIVSVAQNVTVNADIVDNGINSFLYNNDDELLHILEKILKNEINFIEIGKLAKEKIDKAFTFTGNAEKYVETIK